MSPLLRTISFWACVVMAVVNVGIFSLARHLGNRPLQELALLTLAVCVVGAGSHWYVERLLKK